MVDMARGYDPFDPEVLADPYPSYRWLRAEAPLYHVATRGYWVLSRYADVHAVFRDHAAFSSTKGVAPEPGFAPGLIGTDPPKHTRLRRVLQGVFTPKAIERSWGARVQAIADSLLDQAIGAGVVDAFSALSLALPIQVIAEILGIPDGDLVQFKRWSDHMTDGVMQHLDADIKQRTEEAFRGLAGYFTEKAAERRARPGGDDLISKLCQAGDEERLTDREIVHFCILLLIAGNETTTNLLGNGLLALLAHPAEEALLRARPELVPDAIEEMLRYRPPTQSTFRQTTREFTLHGQTIPADSRVMLSIASANHDEAQYGDDAHVFRVTRTQVDHVAFGSGIHFCLGSALARLEVRSVLAPLLRRTRALRAAGTPRLQSTITVRGPVYLPIELVAA
jgi:cytochrome P450